MTSSKLGVINASSSTCRHSITTQPLPHLSYPSNTYNRAQTSVNIDIIMSAYPGQIAPDPATTMASGNPSNEVREPSEVVQPRKVHNVAQQGYIHMWSYPLLVS